MNPKQKQKWFDIMLITCFIIFPATVIGIVNNPIQQKSESKVSQSESHLLITRVRMVDAATSTTPRDMFEAIKLAAAEFNVPEGLILGIANAESSMGTNFYNPRDKDIAHNWWGIKGGETNQRIKNENSWLRAFHSDLAGARTVAKTLKLYYIDEGRITPEQIANKWVGKNQTPHHKQWIKNVNKYYRNL